MNKRSAVLMSAVLLWLVACQSCKSETQGESGGHTNWLICTTMSECAGRPEAATCSSEGYCLDEKGNRLEIGSVGTGGDHVKPAIDGGRASQVATDAGAGGGGSAVATGGASGTAAGTDAGAAVCSEFNQPAPPSTPVSVRFFNATANNIFLGPTTETCGPRPSFTAEKDGDPLRTAPLIPCDDIRCDSLQSASCVCNPFCAPVTFTLIAPGKFYSIDWRGLVVVSKSVPEACRPAGGCSDTCAMEEALGAVTLKAVASAQITCEAGAACPACTQNANGTCSVQGQGPGGYPTLTGTTLTGSALWSGESEIQIDLK